MQVPRFQPRIDFHEELRWDRDVPLGRVYVWRGGEGRAIPNAINCCTKNVVLEGQRNETFLCVCECVCVYVSVCVCVCVHVCVC